MSLKPNMETQNGHINGTNGSSSFNKTLTNGNSCPDKKQKRVYLHNLQDDTLSVEDSLHHKAEPVLPHLHCKKQVCLGSMMRRDGVVVKEAPSKERVWEEAQTYLDEYYDSLPESLRGEHKEKRVKEVHDTIMSTGTYEQTLPEVTYGAKLAWRNASRCIGRIQWANMQFFDCRNATSTTEMFNAICQHLKYATNGGTIRSAMTLFPQTVNNVAPCRIWSPQFISYAGYPNEDGTVLGDPGNLEFTKICLKLGWKKTRTRFDILPLVLQYGDEDPEVFDIPDELVLRVKLRHPTNKKFSELNLEWYSVPAVCNMNYDCGGIVYNACGFSGWYMTTELVKDLTDPSRYDLLQEIAECMGYDTNEQTFLWKDTSAIELNIAIAHSFQKDRVTIVDHHTASESFMRHFANETKLRGGCPGDWVWINPPIGGSLTQVHHQEMLNYKLLPAYDYQPAPWVTHVWKNPLMARKKPTFASIARTVSLTTNFMNKALMKRIPVTILFGSETGTSEHFADSLRKVFNQAFNAKVVCMCDYDIGRLKSETLVIVIASTFGNGDPPENGRQFMEILSTYAAEDTKRRRLSDQQRLTNLTVIQFATFGLGSSAYPQTFCEFGKDVDELLATGMQFVRILPFATGDALKNQEKEFSVWSNEVFQKACTTFNIDTKDIQMDMRVTEVMEYNKKSYKVLKSPENKVTVTDGLKTIHNKVVGDCEVKSVDALTAPNATKETILVQLTSKVPLPYKPGDHVAVFPTNNMDDVELIVQHTILPAELMPSDLVSMEIQVITKAGKKTWESLPRLPACSMRDALIYYLDIDTPPAQSFFKQLVANDCVEDENELEKIKELAEDDKAYRRLDVLDRPSIGDILRKFPSIYFPPSLVLSQLPLLRARFYSVSSAPSSHPSELHITAAILDYDTPGQDGTPIPHKGLCTNWLKNLKPGAPVRVYIRTAPDFWLPENPETPVIMVGPGSGVAPYRSFWLERKSLMAKGEKFGPMELFYGCRGEAEQFYKEEMEDAKKCGVFSQYHVAYSRKPDVPKTYVQQDLKTRSASLKRLILEEGAYMYVCGDITMANDVAETVCGILTEGNKAVYRKKDDEKVTKVKTLVEKLKAAGRYKEDIYGVSSAIEGTGKLQGM